MPSRILREGILDSDRIEQLDWPAEVFYRRLMSKVDDYGLFDARLTTLRTTLYPLRVDRVREADIARWVAMCEAAGVIALYEHGGKPFGQMLETRWQARSEPKHPLPPWGKGVPLCTVESNCAQLPTPAPVFGVVVVDEKKGVRKRSPTFDASQIELPEWLDREDWQRWCTDRKERRKPVTEEGAKAQLRKLDEYRQQGHKPGAVIDHSIAGGYQGLFAPAVNRAQVQAGAPTVPSNAAAQTTALLAERGSIVPSPEKARAARASLKAAA